MKVFRFSVTGIVVTYDNEYTFYEFKNDRFKEFKDYGYSGNISIAMAKINNLILGHPDYYLEDIHVTEVDKSQDRFKGEHRSQSPEMKMDEIIGELEVAYHSIIPNSANNMAAKKFVKSAIDKLRE